jgi:thymidylate synthase
MKESLPILSIEGDNLTKVWEEAVLALWKDGAHLFTEYDQWSKDCTMLMAIREPFSEPRIHLGGLCGGLEDLDKYVKEVVEGSEDHFVYEGKRPYEYHERLFNYIVADNLKTDQIEYMIERLSKGKEVQFEGKKIKVQGFSRRAQAITWKPWIDPSLEHPPCLQRIWCRVVGDKLVMETCWRSRDAYKAAFWNMYAFTELQKKISKDLSKKIGANIEPGQYVDFSNSFHIYGNDFEDFENRFTKLIKERTFERRTLSTSQFLEMIKK